MEGRQISGAMLIGNKVVDLMLKKKDCRLLDLDIEKVYDHVKWGFW